MIRHLLFQKNTMKKVYKHTKSRAISALLCACLLTFITGSSYVFAIFRGPAIERFGVDGAMGAYALTNAIAPLPMLIGGFFIDRGKAVWTATCGAFFAALGWGLAAGAQAPGIFVATYGFVGGIGMGLILTSALSNTLRFFPGKRGLIAGIISCINGAAGMIMAPIAQKIIGARGLGATLYTFATIFFIIGIIVALFYRAAPVEGVELCKSNIAPQTQSVQNNDAGAERHVTATQKTPHTDTQLSLEPASTPSKKRKNDEGVEQKIKGVSVTPGRSRKGIRGIIPSFAVLATLDFWLLFLLFTCGAFSGLMVVSNSVGIATGMYGLTSMAAAFYVSLYSIAGTLGRFAFGWISDAIGKTRALQLTFFADACGLAVLTLLPGSALALGVGLFTVGITFGGTIAIMPAFVMDRFGPANQGINYALVFCGFSLAAMLSPKLGAKIGIAHGGDFSTAFYIAMIAAALGFVCASLLGRRAFRHRYRSNSTTTGT